MTGNIDNGTREDIEAGQLRAENAGIVTLGGVTEAAFFGNFRDWKDARDALIGGQPYRIDKVERSDRVDGMVRLTVTAVTQ